MVRVVEEEEAERVISCRGMGGREAEGRVSRAVCWALKSARWAMDWFWWRWDKVRVGEGWRVGVRGVVGRGGGVRRMAREISLSSATRTLSCSIAMYIWCCIPFRSLMEFRSRSDSMESL